MQLVTDVVFLMPTLRTLGSLVPALLKIERRVDLFSISAHYSVICICKYECCNVWVMDVMRWRVKAKPGAGSFRTAPRGRQVTSPFDVRITINSKYTILYTVLYT